MIGRQFVVGELSNTGENPADPENEPKKAKPTPSVGFRRYTKRTGRDLYFCKRLHYKTLKCPAIKSFLF